MTGSKKKLYKVIAEQIEQYILTKNLQIGDRLPPERELANLFNSSRTSVREALRKFEIKGVLEIKQGSGTYIKSLDQLIPARNVTSTIHHADHTNIYEMLDLRRILEVECAAMASSRATSVDLARIRATLLMMEEADSDEAGLQSDLNFHLSIVEASHHTVFIQLIASLTEHMKETIRVTRTNRLADPSRIQGTINEHKEIYVAIATGESEKAKMLMEEHITRVRKELTESMLV
ncbi:GntR family transcriptional regulator, transcriptional repressor for pyruvate dehydrogenase complex [Cytobacillus horneckiae]|uniref:FadR family transcriptional regulator n=1 Tax=Cytobacillus horneckiae TaxID=549687 RepID=A0A2N0ZGE5_9BACI|nr:FadR/GntR family transcriptional regulator [Cytobacillus horneckiae]MBN6888232.1 FadR family transcriptional regulator [Cytobacillus horneckiae]MCM3177088.1 FadR family transcriptional regulator [Cytobacillus horneckiae]MEC1154787.1 FadR/GntR family transcriptional regulator [Cytobacillus horneckiae]MED2940281.1 FadR/GntR family transcriptional regulator [Cytobacillus horneckiae]PKG28581.1 FadR family transcriptional regulator [Cytobacillus horneckiae]